MKINLENKWGKRPASRFALFNLPLFLNEEKCDNLTTEALFTLKDKCK